MPAKPPTFKRECAMPGCSNKIELRWKYCTKHRRWAEKDRPDIDAFERRVPGSFESGKRR